MTERLSGWRSEVLWVAAVLAAVAAVVMVLAALAIRDENQRARAQAQRAVDNLAMVLADHLASVVERADERMTAGVDPKLQPAPGPLKVFGPEQTVDGQWVLRLERERPGQPALQARVPVRRLSELLDKLDLGHHGAVTIRTLDLALVTRKPLPPGDAAPMMGSRDVSQALRDAVRRDPQGGAFTASTVMDGVARVNAFRQVPGYPLLVLAGLPEDDYPQLWSRREIPILVIAVASIASVALAAGLLLRASRRRVAEVERRFEAIVESSQDAIVSKTLDGVITSWNAAAEHILGWRAEDMIGRSLRQIVPADLLDEEDQIIERLRRGEVTESLETERLHRDGHRVPLSLTISPVRDARGHIVGASKIGRDIRRRKALEAEIRQLAFEDALTRLPNRRLFFDRLGQALKQAQREQQWGAVIFLDLDSFKALNDSQGHDVGDLLLQEVAQRLRSAVRAVDTVARLGGDEFVVLCVELAADRPQAEAAAALIEAKLVQTVEMPWHHAAGTHVPRISVGHSVFGAADSAERILHEADARMYACKRQRQSQAKPGVEGRLGT